MSETFEYKFDPPFVIDVPRYFSVEIHSLNTLDIENVEWVSIKLRTSSIIRRVDAQKGSPLFRALKNKAVNLRAFYYELRPKPFFDQDRYLNKGIF